VPYRCNRRLPNRSRSDERLYEVWPTFESPVFIPRSHSCHYQLAKILLSHSCHEGQPGDIYRRFGDGKMGNWAARAGNYRQ
jgi:hypothetical protein